MNAKKIHELRKARGLAQHELADALGVSQAAVSNWEKGTNAPPADLLERLASFFGVPITDFFGGDSSAHKAPRVAIARRYIEQGMYLIEPLRPGLDYYLDNPVPHNALVYALERGGWVPDDEFLDT